MYLTKVVKCFSEQSSRIVKSCVCDDILLHHVLYRETKVLKQLTLLMVFYLKAFLWGFLR